MAEFVLVDASWLPENWETDSDLTVELYPDGQLEHLARRREGRLVTSLDLEQGVARGRQTYHRASGGAAGWVSHVDGYSENYDAWSDNSQPYRDPFPDFVRRSIELVVKS